VAGQHGLGYAFKFTGLKRAVSGGLSAINFQVTVQGDFDGIRSFIREMKDLPYFITLLDTEILSQQNDVFNSNINGIIYFNGNNT
jgi:hypothetical protein